MTTPWPGICTDTQLLVDLGTLDIPFCTGIKADGDKNCSHYYYYNPNYEKTIFCGLNPNPFSGEIECRAKFHLLDCAPPRTPPPPLLPLLPPPLLRLSLRLRLHRF